MAFYRLPFKNCILCEDSFPTWQLPKTFVGEESLPSRFLWGILVCPALTHSKYCSRFIECSVGLSVGGHGHCSGCVLSLQPWQWNGAFSEGRHHHSNLCFMKISSHLGHHVSLYLLSVLLPNFFLANHKHVFRHLGLKYPLCSLDHNYKYDWWICL